MLERNEQKVREFDPIFHPRSIAVVGVSEDPTRPGSLYFNHLLSKGFKGRVYPVNLKGGEFFGYRVYRSVREIPESVEYVIVAVPREAVLDVLEDCASKGVKVVQIFTAGFAELGDALGRQLQEEMVKKARRGGFRIIGPNCVGIYSPRVNLPYYAPIPVLGKYGSVAFISQSGSIGARIAYQGDLYGIRFSKGVSYGNGCDLDSTDFLEYLAIDPETKVIGGYIEGVKDGRRLFELLKQVTLEKPVVLLRGGKTPTGAVAALSHTASLISSNEIWEALLKQTGTIGVEGIEEFIDTLLAFQELRDLEGIRIALVSGLVDGGGGQSVLGADVCAALGLEVPSFSEETRKTLGVLLGYVGSILPNPLDLSQAYANPPTIYKAIETISADPNIDLIVFQENFDFLLDFLPKVGSEEVSVFLLNVVRASNKPVIMVLEPGLAERERLTVTKRLLEEAGVLSYPTLERAAKAIYNVFCYSRHRRTKNSGLV